jgi:hypothetical protein
MCPLYRRFLRRALRDWCFFAAALKSLQINYLEPITTSRTLEDFVAQICPTLNKGRPLMSPTSLAKKVRDVSIGVDPRVPRRPLPVAALAVVLLVVLCSCGGSGDKVSETPDAGAIRADAKQVFAPAWSTNAAPPPEPGGIHEIGSVLDGLPAGVFGAPAPSGAKPQAAAAGPVDASASQWTIAIGVFRGDNNYEEAGQTLSRVRSEGGLPNAYLQRRGPATLVAFGSYSGPTDARAQADLSRIQSMVAGGQRLYAGAYLCPPFQGKAISQLGEYDLRRARQTYGDAAMYTLQVGWYGREDLPRTTEADLKEARQAAEEAAERLRREGELAFYFHGPNRSMVTVGIFDATDFDPIQHPGVESTRLRDARRRHPLNLYNGAGYSYKSPGMREAKLLPSGLVAIPNK